MGPEKPSHEDYNMSPYALIRPFALTVLISAAFAAHAGDGRIPTDQDKLPKGVPSAPAVAAQCMACHGPAGQSQYEDWPSLAGQKQSYLLQQLQDFKSGARKDPMMAPVVAQLSDADLKKLAEHFSAQPALQPRQPLAANAAVPAAAAACMACHDNAALPSEPFLRGQKVHYLTEQLKAFRDGKRKNAVMEAMAKPLSDADVTAIAEHFSRLAPLAAPKK
jgi:cytochrome c553